jgi:hypothetical protein
MKTLNKNRLSNNYGLYYQKKNNQFKNIIQLKKKKKTKKLKNQE